MNTTFICNFLFLYKLFDCLREAVIFDQNNLFMSSLHVLCEEDLRDVSIRSSEAGLWQISHYRRSFRASWNTHGGVCDTHSEPTLVMCPTVLVSDR